VNVSLSLGEGMFREKLDELALSKRPRRALAFFFVASAASLVALVTGAFYLYDNADNLLDQLSFSSQAIEALKKVTRVIFSVGAASLIGWSIFAIQSLARRIGGVAV
jgi:hypothetical protein